MLTETMETQMPETNALALRVAARLANEIDPALVQYVEAELERSSAKLEPPKRYAAVDLLSVASFIVSVVGVVWTIRRDLRHDAKQKADHEALVRRVRVALREVDAPSVELRDRIVEEAVSEVLASDEEVQTEDQSES